MDNKISRGSRVHSQIPSSPPTPKRPPQEKPEGPKSVAAKALYRSNNKDFFPTSKEEGKESHDRIMKTLQDQLLSSSSKKEPGEEKNKRA